MYERGFVVSDHHKVGCAVPKLMSISFIFVEHGTPYNCNSNKFEFHSFQRVLLEDISWQEFEAILNELGEHRNSRVAYREGTLEIMVPLPEHERAKVIIGDLVKILLDELDFNWESFDSTTFKREDMTAGVEPDDCFYIQNYKSLFS